MTTEVNGAKPQDTEIEVDLFAKDFDDKQLVEQPDLTPNNEVVNSEKPVATEDSAGLPEKYRDKSIEDVVKMHQELERAYGRHNNELGELRKVTEQYLQQQLSGDNKAELKPIDADTLLENPDAVLKNTVENSPAIKQLEAKLVARERADNLTAFNRAFPQAKDQLSDPRFSKWIEESPTRAKLLSQADQNYDYELMGELLNNFTVVTGETQQDDADEAKRKLTNAKPSGGAGNSGPKKPVFTQKQLAKLQIDDPRRYEALQDVIMDAYENGRVR